MLLTVIKLDTDMNQTSDVMMVKMLNFICVVSYDKLYKIF